MAKKQTNPEQQKKPTQKTAVQKKTRQALKGSPPAQQSGLGGSIDNAQQLSAADTQDMQQTYGNHFLQRLVGVSLDGNEEEDETTMRTADDNAGMSVSDGVENRIDKARGGGQGLPGGFQQQMEGQFGADFGNVRVHTDGESDTLNQSLQAKAFTTGSDIFFRQGEYDTSSTEGQKLVAHELTHVVQQGGTQRKPVQPQMTVNPPGDQYEQEADAAAEQAVTGAQTQTAAPPSTGSGDNNIGPEAETNKTGGETAVSDNQSAQPAEQSSMSAAPVSDDGAVEELMSIKDHPAVKEATDDAKKEAKGQEGEAQQGGEEVTAVEGDAGKPKETDSNTQQEQDPVAAAKEDAQETADQAEGGEAKKEKKEDEKKKPQEQVEKGVPKIKKEDTGPIEDMKYDTEKLEEPDIPERLPSWDALAYGTVQTFAVDEVVAESRQRDLLLMGPTVLESTDEPAADEGKDSGDKDEEEADEVTGDGAEIDKFDLIKDAFIGGASQGMLEGATEFATDQAMESALSKGPAKKIPYADGAMNVAQIAMDPEGWAKGVESAFGKEGANKMAEGWGNIGDEKTWAGKIAGFLEATIGTIDWINTMLGYVQQILQTVLFILAGIAAALSATGVGASVVPILLKIIAFLEKINNLVIKVNDFLQYGVKPPLEVMAILFRTIDIAIFEGDPDELIEKQQKLKGTVSSLAKSTTQRTLNSKFEKKQGDKENAKLEDAKTKRREEIDKTPDDIPDPKTGKTKDEMVNDYESEYGSSYDVDSRQVKGEKSDDPVDQAQDAKLESNAQVKKAEKDLELAQEAAQNRRFGKDKESIDTVEAKQKLDAAKKQQEDADDAVFDAQTGKMMDEGGLFGMDTPAPTPDKKPSKWDRVKDKTSKFDDKVFRGQGKDMVGEYKNVTKKEDWFSSNSEGWSGQRHGAGVTGQSTNLAAMMLERMTGGKWNNVTDISKDVLKSFGIEVPDTGGAEEYGASVIEFEMQWSDDIDDGWTWQGDEGSITDPSMKARIREAGGANKEGVVAELTTEDSNTKARWKNYDWKDNKQVKTGKPAPDSNPELIVQPGTYEILKPKGLLLLEKSGEDNWNKSAPGLIFDSKGASQFKDGSPEFTKEKVTVDHKGRQKVELPYSTNEHQENPDEPSIARKPDDNPPEEMVVQREPAEANETQEDQDDTIPVDMVMDLVLGGMMNEGEPVAEESDALEPDSAGYGLGMDLQMIQQERTLDIIESLPEPPESAREVTAAAETYNLLAAQEGITEMRQQDIEMRQEDAQSQIIEMEKVQEVTAVNQNALVGYQQDVNQKLAAQ
ncbi:MAG: DUF4157 domain-containing protein, partial [bacterium]|nr:DUF4157 domain-containing protein [bacterium]